MVAAKHLEESYLLQLAQQYREQGYQVFIEPRAIGLEGIPDTWRLDIVAHKEQETVVVEITSRQRMDEQPGRLTALAEAVQRRSGWRLETIIVNEPTDQGISADLPFLSYDEIVQQLDSAKAFFGSNQLTNAFQVSWLALKAITRYLLEGEEPDYRPTNLITALKTLIAFAYLTQDDYSVLEHGIKIQRQLDQQEPIPDLDGAFVGKLIDITARLLAENSDAMPSN
jgi:hypothetical protein